jgi:predicted PurR-regulated permease PerM
MDNPSVKYLKSINAFLGILLAIAGVYVLMSLSSFLIPFVIAILLTFIFSPIVEHLQKKKVPKPLGILICFLIILVFFALIGALIGSNLSQMSQRLPEYGSKIGTILQDLLTPYNITLQQLGKKINIDIQNPNISELIGKLFDSGLVQKSLASLTSVMSNALLILIFWLFMIAGKEKFEKKIYLAFAHKGKDVSNIWKDIIQETQSYLFLKTIINLCNGTIATILFLFYGLDYAVLLGFFVFIFSYIPNLGPIFFISVPVVFAFVQFGVNFYTFSLIILFVISQLSISHFIEPKVTGSRLDLSPVYILFSVFFWGWVWGIVGAFLAVPIAVLIKILCSHVPSLKPASVFMSGFKEVKQKFQIK